MADTQNEDEISNLTKFLALTAVTVLMIIAFALFALLSKDDPSAPYACDTNLNPTACPEPDYDKELEEQLKQYPDDSY